MKKILLAFILLGLGGLARAEGDFVMEKDRNFNIDLNLRNVGVDIVSLVRSTNPALVTDADGNTVSQGLIYWIIRPATGAAGSFLEVRDTATASRTSARMLPWIAPVSTMTATLHSPDPMIRFDPPAAFYNGLSVNTLPGASGSDGVVGTEWAIGIRKKK